MRALPSFGASTIALVGVSIFAVAACSSSSSSSAQSAPDAATGRACAVGTITQLDGSCAPADFAVACAAGFAADPSGYGCHDVLPADPCVGATRAALGQTSCVPVGDCTAAFPPANATLFVSATGVSNATHFTTIGAAVAAATPGAVIAVDSGDYAESVQIAQSVSIIGKCPANVIIDGKGGVTAQGIAVNGANPVNVSGVTIRGEFIALSVEPSGVLTMTHSVLDSNYAVGISMETGGATVTLDDVVVRSTQGNNEPGFGINVQNSSILNITNSEITGNHDTAIRVSTSGKLTIASSVISNTQPFPGYAYGRGLSVQSGGIADVSTTAFVNNMENAIVLTASTSTFKQITVRDTQPTPSGAFGRGIDAFDGGNFTLDSSTFDDLRDVAIIVVNSTMSMTKSVVQNTHLGGINEDGAFGRGLAIQEGSKATIEGCAILQSHDSGIAVFSAGTTADISKSFIQGTQFNGEGTVGYGVVGVDAAVTIENSEVDSCVGAGVGFAGAGILSSSVVSNNAVGIATPDDITLTEIPPTPGAQIVANTAEVTSDTKFIANQTRSASGTVPLPSEITN